ncbi:membrane protein [Sediminicola sp. YIK13]|nr:membrane protein [Sediminicola sp. YIK13]
MASVSFCYYYNINFNVDLTLLSIAIIFPLVFTIRGSFRRREKALEHLSKYRSAMKTLQYFITTSTLLDKEEASLKLLLENIEDKTILHLKSREGSIKDLDEEVEKVFEFIHSRRKTISKSLKDKLFKYMCDLHEAIDNLNGIHMHRTPMSLKAYCKVFIYIFPLIYAPTIIFNIGETYNPFAVYFVVILTEFILISLYNIQDDLEYPFDDKGLDDIQLDHFKVLR